MEFRVYILRVGDEVLLLWQRYSCKDSRPAISKFHLFKNQIVETIMKNSYVLLFMHRLDVTTSTHFNLHLVKITTMNFEYSKHKYFSKTDKHSLIELFENNSVIWKSANIFYPRSPLDAPSGVHKPQFRNYCAREKQTDWMLDCLTADGLFLYLTRHL